MGITVVVKGVGWINRNDSNPPRFRKTLFAERYMEEEDEE